MITINGSSYSGRTIKVENGKVTIDGKEVTSDDKVINIYVVGDLDRIDVGMCENLIIDGNVNHLNAVSGDVHINNDAHDVRTTSGDVEIAGDCKGSVNTVSGDVKAKTIAGNVKTVSGDVKSDCK